MVKILYAVIQKITKTFVGKIKNISQVGILPTRGANICLYNHYIYSILSNYQIIWPKPEICETFFKFYLAKKNCSY